MQASDLEDWARGHQHLSVHTIRRYFPVTKAQAETLIAGLVGLRVLHDQPEGVVYRVRYSTFARRRPPVWWNADLPGDYPPLHYRNL